MATAREYLSSVLGTLALAQNVSDEVLSTWGVESILKDMDDLASELREVIE